MKIKNITECIKNHRIKLAIASGCLAALITTSTLCGVFIKHQPIEINKKPPVYIYQPGVVEFDENGKIKIPVVIDKDNPNNVYEHMPIDVTDTKIPDETLQDKKFQDELNKQNNENKKSLKTLLKDVLDKEIKVTNKVKMVIDNIIPNNHIKIGDTSSVEQFFDSVYQDATELYKDKSLNTQQVKDLCAISGINLNKEYNNIINTMAEEPPAIFGGGGVTPPPNIPPPPPQDNGIDANTITFSQQEKISKDNEKYLWIFAVTNSVVLSVLTVISITLTILAVLTGGASLVTLASIIPDIIFASYTIWSSWDEYFANKDAYDFLFNKVVKDIMKALSIGNDMNTYFEDKPIIYSINKLKKLTNYDKWKFQFKHYEKLSKKVKWISYSQVQFAKKMNSIVSIAYTLTMEFLYETLIKENTWLMWAINGK